jgi:toxin ParE1/3/4
MTFKVIISASAKADLFAIYDYIADRAGADIAFRFVEAIEAYYLGFAYSPERCTRRDDLRAGLRTVGFKRRATILFEVNGGAKQVVILGICYAGRSFELWNDNDADS